MKILPFLSAAFISSHIFCISPSGPPFRPEASGSIKPEPGRFFFDPSIVFYKESQAGEILIKETGKTNFAPFVISIAGITANKIYQVRMYKGSAGMENGLLNLYSEKCFLFSGRSPDSRLAPVRSWDCDHLIFRFEKKRGGLHQTEGPLPESEEWIGPIRPASVPAGAFYAGQVLEQNEEGELLVFSRNGSRLVNAGQKISVYRNDGSLLLGKVAERFGDFISVDVGRSEAGGGAKAVTFEAPKRSGFFD